MTEEKEAIEIIKSIININKENERTTAMLYVSDVDILLNLIEKLQKENEELKNKVIKRDNDIIYLEETAEKEFLTKQEVKENYISKGKIREKIKELEKQSEEVKNFYKGTYAWLDEYLNAKSKIQGYKELLEEE